ncbi:hypothetical protein V6N12_044664 [Hibiscus sabdariffa]|uniref:Uncharacterized protein n=1 Tax=Hibiscus sabdariffa TaxID=183260 RepID=A0ABR2AXY5_9ROSI
MSFGLQTRENRFGSQLRVGKGSDQIVRIQKLRGTETAIPHATERRGSKVRVGSKRGSTGLQNDVVLSRTSSRPSSPAVVRRRRSSAMKGGRNQHAKPSREASHRPLPFRRSGFAKWPPKRHEKIMNGGSDHRRTSRPTGETSLFLRFIFVSVSFSFSLFGFGIVAVAAPVLDPFPPSLFFLTPFWFTGMGIYTQGRGSLLGHVEDVWRVLRCVSWPVTRDESKGEATFDDDDGLKEG